MKALDQRNPKKNIERGGFNAHFNVDLAFCAYNNCFKGILYYALIGPYYIWLILNVLKSRHMYPRHRKWVWTWVKEIDDCFLNSLYSNIRNNLKLVIFRNQTISSFDLNAFNSILKSPHRSFCIRASLIYFQLD